MNTTIQCAMKLLVSMCFLVSLGACSPASDSEQPSGDSSTQERDQSSVTMSSFKGDYAVRDFNLSVASDYWETRTSYDDQETYSVDARYGRAEYVQLSGFQQTLLSQQTASTGFATKCRPGTCPVYGASLVNNQVTLITNRSELKRFFGDIDTEAELFVWLSYEQGYRESVVPKTFEVTSDGYLVELNWDTQCQLRGKDLVKVTRDGNIEKVKEISREEYDSCV